MVPIHALGRPEKCPKKESSKKAESPSLRGLGLTGRSVNRLHGCGVTSCNDNALANEKFRPKRRLAADD
jgi:hypothetical protein